MMKKSVSQTLAIMAGVCLSFMASAQGQYSKNNFTFSIGLFQKVRYKYDLAMNGIEVHPDELWNASPFCRKIPWGAINVRNTGPVTFGYLRRVSKKIAVGGNINGGYYKRIYWGTEYKQSLAHLGLAADGRYYYYLKNKWEFYGAVSFGMRYQYLYSAMPDGIGYYPVKSFYPIYQISPLCINYGKKAKAFAEFGIGYKGYMSTGVQIGL